MQLSLSYSTAHRQFDMCGLNTRNLLSVSTRLVSAAGKTCQHYFCKRKRMWAKRALQRVFTRVHTFPSVIMYTYICSHLVSFLRFILCATVTCITIYASLRYRYIKKSSSLSSVLEERRFFGFTN